MESPYLSLTLSELKTLRRSWLDQGRAQAQALREVVEILGEQVGSRYTPTLYRTIKTYRAQAWLYETTAGWAGDRYQVRGRLWVEVGKVTVANLYFWDGEYQAECDSVYIPGPWLDEILAMGDAARAEIEHCQAERDARERQWLIEQLGIGVIV